MGFCTKTAEEVELYKKLVFNTWPYADREEPVKKLIDEADLARLETEHNIFTNVVTFFVQEYGFDTEPGITALTITAEELQSISGKTLNLTLTENTIHFEVTVAKEKES